MVMETKLVRILHVIGIMNRGGAETMIMNLYRYIDRSKVQFDFVVHSVEKAAFDDEIYNLGGKIFYCPKFNGKNYFEYKKWWKDFFSKDGKEYKIVHGHIGSTASIYLKIAKKYGKYAIAHSHSSGTDYSLKQVLYKIMSYNTRNIADYFFACSDAAGKDRFGTKVVNNQSKYKVLNNAIDTSLFVHDENVRKNIRKELQFEDGQLVIGHVGRFTAEKNHGFILDVFKEILNKKNNAQLVLVGDGPLRKSIEEKAEKMSLKGKIHFLGIRSDVNQLMQAMDVLLFPSVYEGLPVTLVEAQTSGLPCVISSAIPAECVLTDGVVKIKSLDDSLNEWGTTVINAYNANRTNHVREIIEHRYDIAETAIWLEDFYVRTDAEQS